MNCGGCHLCLEHDSTRNEIMVITLLDGEGLEATANGQRSV